jgi:hypothetical protein
MRPLARSLPVVAVAAVAVFAAVATLKSQDNVPARPEVWEYATVVGRPHVESIFDGLQSTVKGLVKICFASDKGCRYEAVEVILASGTTVPSSYNQGFAKAAVRLGSEGWELTNTVAVDPAELHMYFRRPLLRR